MEFIAILIIIAGVFSPQEPDNMVVLLAEEDGSVGQVVVTTKGGSQTLNSAGSGTVIASAEAAPSAPVTVDQATLNGVFGKVLAAHPKAPQFFRLFFKTGGHDLTDASKALLPQILTAIEGRDNVEVSVIGHTDRVGSAADNAALALDRAKEIRQTLVGLGVPQEAIEVRSHGENDPLVKTADDVAHAENRRVEINIR